jgi:penicillin-binding protein 1A
MRGWRYALVIPAAAALIACELAIFAAIVLYPRLPSIDELVHYNPQLPLRIYTADGTLIGEYGEEQRAFVRLQDVPPRIKQAILAAEDARFYEHGAVDLMGVLRALAVDLDAGAASQGASTITMQVVRTLFLNPEKTFSRKLFEMMLAYKVEHTLSKDQILEIYINQIYLGQRTYGFAAAAKVYFGKDLKQLTVKEAAILAGLPKAPSRFNPAASQKLALERAGYVLSRMKKLGYITDTEYRQAIQAPLHVVHGGPRFRLDAAYVAEMVRQHIYEEFGENAYTMGYKVYTTLRDADQLQANLSVRSGVLAYDRRHGYLGPEGFVSIKGDALHRQHIIEKTLAMVDTINGLEPAIVLQADPQAVTAWTKSGKTIAITGAGLEFVHAALLDHANSRNRLRPGSLIRVQRRDDAGWEITQAPQVEAALVSISPTDGAVLALCGGFDFERSQFNHITQALRQPGSGFKPFIYSAALEKGYTPATLIDDAPIVIPPAYPGGEAWSPSNYENDFLGPITLRYALAESRNVDAVRVIEKIGVPYARDFASHFGLPLDQIPPYPSMVLGAGSFTPLQMASAYAVFANGGFLVKPYFIERIVDGRGNVLYQAQPAVAGKDAQQVIDPRNAYTMTSLLQDVTRIGTAAHANSLGRHDIAGKTGTTENFVDAWFNGYNPERLAVVWVGFDQPRSLGKGETGARAALPIWMEYMGNILKSMPDTPYAMPPGIVVAKINPKTGQRVPDNRPGTMEYFYAENVPALPGSTPMQPAPQGSADGAEQAPPQPAERPAAHHAPAHTREPAAAPLLPGPRRQTPYEAGAGIDAQSLQTLKFAERLLADRQFQAAAELAGRVLQKYPHNMEAQTIQATAKGQP